MTDEEYAADSAIRDFKVAALGRRPGWWRPFARRRWDRRRAAITATTMERLVYQLTKLSYPREWVEDLAKREHPLFRIIRKEGS